MLAEEDKQTVGIERNLQTESRGEVLQIQRRVPDVVEYSEKDI